MRAVVLGLLLWLFAGAAAAEIQLSFYAHPGARVRDGYLLFPHAYVHATGMIEATGEVVDWSAGFTAASPGPHLLFVKGPGVVAEPDARYVSEGQGFLTVVLDDAAFQTIRERAEWWNSPEGRTYDLRRRNCITFIADLARLAGLATAREPSMRPGGFLEATAALNPEAVWRPDPVAPGILASEPVAPERVVIVAPPVTAVSP